MRLAIYGAGSIGTALGAFLTRNGVAIDLFNHNRPHVEALRKSGARIVGTVDFTVPVRALFPEEMTGIYDVVFLMTKQLDNRRVLEGILPHLGPQSIVCTMQNGLPEPSVASVLGPDRTYGCTVGWGATLKEPGIVELTSEPTREALAFNLGAMTGRHDAMLDEIARILSLMGNVTIERNLMGARWSKLLVNAAFSGLGTCFGCTFGGVSDHRIALLAAQRIIKEGIDVARLSGVTMEPIQGKDIVKLFDYRGWFKRQFGLILIPIAIKKHRAIRPSMLQDLERGKKCEIDAINGAIAAQGDIVGLDTPFDDLVVAIVKEIETGNAQPGWHHLERFAGLLNQH
ncbi:MAG: ketopantoate reductase family protein [Bacillota bacterium]|nr:ketopantoate reductase family protein [Bacillota bacterium]